MSDRIEAFANPKVLVWARRMAGLELEDAARHVCAGPKLLESWEKGEARPTIRQLRLLAEKYKRPLAVFFLEKRPPDEETPSDFRRFDPKAAEPMSPALRLAIRTARARREAAIELFEELNEQPPSLNLTAILKEDPERVGGRLREALVTGTSSPSGDARTFFNFWRAAAERVGVLVFQAEGVHENEMRGFSISERPLPAIVLNIKEHSYAARSFSVFHELTHVMLNQGGLCIFEEQGPQTDFQRTEVFCNHVAGAALLPASSLLREEEVPARRVSEMSEWAIGDLARRYGASRETVLRRLVILNRIPLSFYRRKRAEYRRHPKPPQGGFAPPYTMAVATGGPFFTRLVLSAYDEERITASDVAGYIGVRLKHLERIRAAVDIGEPA